MKVKFADSEEEVADLVDLVGRKCQIGTIPGARRLEITEFPFPLPSGGDLYVHCTDNLGVQVRTCTGALRKVAPVTRDNARDVVFHIATLNPKNHFPALWQAFLYLGGRTDPEGAFNALVHQEKLYMINSY